LEEEEEEEEEEEARIWRWNGESIDLEAVPLGPCHCDERQ
jgi:hypothetical protein